MREEGKFLVGQHSHNRTKEYKRPFSHSAYSQKQSSNNPWLLKTSLAVLIVCLLIWAGQKITNPHTAPIRTIQITGNYSHVDRALLRQTILPFVDKGFLWADTSGLQDRLQQLPWIYAAQVKRAWPGKLIINITEQQPVARMSNNVLVNSQGDTFQVNQATIPANLPLFVNPNQGEQKSLLQNYQTMNTILAPLAVKIVAISLDARQSWSLQLDNGIVVIIGKVDPLQRLQRLVTAYPQIVGANTAAINTIDLRYQSGIAVRFNNQSSSVKV